MYGLAVSAIIKTVQITAPFVINTSTYYSFQPEAIEVR
jgi:hypothetical protein